MAERILESGLREREPPVVTRHNGPDIRDERHTGL